MYGPSGKLGRGGAAGKRNSHVPPIKRPASTSRLSTGRGGLSTSAAVASPSTASVIKVEESFTLVRDNPLNFGMAIKLAPNLVEEIKRVEAEGGTARVKFDANSKNPNGNVIQVGDKIFRFTWSREPGDNCDIYEERKSNEDGNGLLVESGATWRKLNVERELDELTKNHVKRRSEEAERKLKSRKAIVLDHQTPSMKNQLKGLASAESNPWRNNFKQRKEPPFKKPKWEQPSAAGPPKPGYKSGLPATRLSKVQLSSGSPLSSQLEQRSSPVSPVVSGNLVKGHNHLPEAVLKKKSNSASSDKEMHSKVPNSTTREKFKCNQNTEAKLTDLRSLIISLLLEHQHSGMNLKALEKAVADSMPNSARQIEPILRQVATFQAPGKYFLKSDVGLESYKEPPPQSGNSPEISRHESPAPQKFNQLPGQDPRFSMKSAARDEGQGELNSTPVHTVGSDEKIEVLDNSSEQLGEKKVSDNSEQVASSSSESDSSDSSDSDSSDSSSDGGSHSRGKSQSPAGSRSGSSSDSESDAAASSSKQASDEDVDIMTSDDEKESKRKLQDTDPVLSKSPLTWKDLDNGYIDIGIHEKQDDHIPHVVDIEKNSPDDAHDAKMPTDNYAVPNEEGAEPVEGINPSSSVQHEQETQDHDRKTYDGLNRLVNYGYKHGQSGTIEISSKVKSKRLLDDKHSDERAQNRKKLKSQPVSATIHSLFGESPSNSSPDRALHVHDKVNRTRITSDVSNDASLQTFFNKLVPDRSVSDTERSGKKSLAASARSEVPSIERRSDKQESLNRGVKYSERSLQSSDGFRTQKGLNAEARSKDGLVNDRRAPSHPNTHIDNSSRDKKTSATDRSQVMNDMGGVLQREHSDFELAEFQEPFNDETSRPKKQFERNSSFRHLENQPVDSENCNSNISRVKTCNNITADRGNLSSPNLEATASVLPDGTSKRKTMERNADDLTKSDQKTTRPLSQHSHIEVGSQQNKGLEIINKSRFAEGGTDQGARLDSNEDTSKKVTQQESDVGLHTTLGNNRMSSVARVSNGRRKDASLSGQTGVSKRQETSLDAGASLYTQYQKEEPELKGPIKDVSQYKEYVEEYQQKYEIYSSLNLVLESYRDEFSKLGKELEACKGRDMKRYNEILEQMRSSFRQCGERHKQLKKLFIVLYEELKHLKQMIKDYAASYKKD